LNLKIAIFLLSLSLSLMLMSTFATSKELLGTFKTETIRELWQACSVAHQSMNTPQHIYYRLCDCAVDVMRVNYDNVTKIQKMSLEDSKQLAVLLRLNCNDYRFEANENASS
jgi:hypothetical protein